MAAQKNKASLTLVFSTLLTFHAYADATITLKLENNLPACLTFGKPIIYSAEGILFAKISYVKKNTLDVCGCKSAGNAFTASAGKREDLIFLMSGNLMFNKAGTVNFPLTMDQSYIPPSKKVDLTISCAEQG